MGRRKHGPRQLKKGGPFFAVLHVQQKDRPLVGKERLIKSLQTADHTEALKRYAAALSQLERELEHLLKPQTLRDRVEGHREGVVRTGDAALTPSELTAITLGSFNPDEPTHVAVYDSFNTGKPLPPSWEEALELWEKEAKRRHLSPSTVPKYHQVVKEFSVFGLPHQITKDIVREWIDDMEEQYAPNTVKTKKAYLGAVYEALITRDKLDTLNPFKAVKYSPLVPVSEQRRPFTDEEISVIYQKHPHIFYMVMTGLRTGEYYSRIETDLQDGFLSINDQPSKNWSLKTPSSHRKVPVPPCFTLDLHNIKVLSKTRVLARQLREDIKDKYATVHSARHTFYSLSRRADCQEAVIEAITGHAKKEGSRVAQSYGDFADKVLLREISKVWDFVHSHILKNVSTTSSIRTT